MGDRWQPDSGQQWLKDTEKRLNILERRWVRGGGGGAGALNKIINGDFRINQRLYTSGAALAPASVLTAYGHDRWRASPSSTTSYTFVQAPNGCTITLNAGGALRQVIERANVPAGDYSLSWDGTARNTLGGAVIRNRVGNPDTLTGGLTFGLAGGTGSFTAPGVVAGGVVATNPVPKPYPKTTGGWVMGGVYPGVLDTTFVRRPGTTSAHTTRQATSPSGAVGVVSRIGHTDATNTTGAAVVAGNTYTVSVYWASSVANARVHVLVSYYTAAGAIVGAPANQPLVSTTTAPLSWNRLTFTPPVVPATAERMVVTFELWLSSGNTVGGEEMWVQDFQIDLGTAALPYIDGEMTDGTAVGQYQYDFVGAAFGSPSTKSVLVAGGKHRLTATGGALTYTYAAPPATEGTSRFTIASGDAYATRVEVSNPNTFDIYVRLSNHWYVAGAGGAIPSATYSPVTTIAAGTTVTLELTGIVPTATSGGAIAGTLPIIWLYSNNALAFPVAGTIMDTTKWAMFSGADAASLKPAEPVPYFSGASTSPDYVMAWLGPADQSASTRTEAHAGSATFTHDGAGDLIIEFLALGGTATLGNVSLMAGSAAYRFQPRLIGEELALCRRYYWRSPEGSAVGTQLGPIGTVTAATTATLQHELAVPMRITPVLESTTTLGVSDLITLSATVTAISINAISRGSMLRIETTFSAGGGTAGRPAYLRSAGANNWIGYSAEF